MNAVVKKIETILKNTVICHRMEEDLCGKRFGFSCTQSFMYWDF